MTISPSSSLLSNDIVYMDGEFIPLSDAKIGIRTPGFLYGTSLFEGIRGYWISETRQISIFRMKEHYERLLTNSRLFYLTPPNQDVASMCSLTEELIRRNKPTTDIYIRPTIYQAGDNVTPSLNPAEVGFCVWTKPLGEYLDLSKGLSVCVSNWRRTDDNAIPARAKAGGAYMNTALAVSDARNAGFDDAIFLTGQGTVSEGSAMNLFLVKDGQLHTPSKTEDILEGITRDTLITLAKEEFGIETIERTIDRTELYVADEAFFCGTGAQVAPITQIDHRLVGTGKPGSITSRLQTLYFEVVKNKHSQYEDWCTLVDC
jgi:branched-chain amino acid aminotransferase